MVTLDALTVPDFSQVGPDGKVLSREQWLSRHAAGLRLTELTWQKGPLTVLGDLAIAVGVQTQRGRDGDRSVDGCWQASHTYVRVSEAWRLVGIELTALPG